MESILFRVQTTQRRGVVILEDRWLRFDWVQEKERKEKKDDKDMKTVKCSIIDFTHFSAAVEFRDLCNSSFSTPLLEEKKNDNYKIMCFSE